MHSIISIILYFVDGWHISYMNMNGYLDYLQSAQNRFPGGINRVFIERHWQHFTVAVMVSQHKLYQDGKRTGARWHSVGFNMQFSTCFSMLQTVQHNKYKRLMDMFRMLLVSFNQHSAKGIITEKWPSLWFSAHILKWQKLQAFFDSRSWFLAVMWTAA